MYKVIILAPAKRDVMEATLWYNFKQYGLGKKFSAQVREKVKFIRKNPKATTIRYDNIVRTALIDTFPFMIHYTLNDEKKQVIISAVLHTSRNPDTW